MASESVLRVLRAEFPWLPDPLLDVLADEYVDTGDPAQAQRAMRLAPEYEQFFPGNRREDGTLRYDELSYLTYVDRAKGALASINVNPDLFEEDIIRAIENDLQVSQVEARIDAAYERIIDRAPEVREFYATNFGIELSDAAIVASVLNPEIGTAILEGRLSSAEIGGQAALRGFGIDLQLADQLRQRDVTGPQAGEIFGAAAESVPILDVLARRHGDPNDDFDLNDFLAASIFDDPVERRRIRRLIQQERESFSTGAFGRSEGGAITGLRQA